MVLTPWRRCGFQPRNAVPDSESPQSHQTCCGKASKKFLDAAFGEKDRAQDPQDVSSERSERVYILTLEVATDIA